MNSPTDRRHGFWQFVLLGILLSIAGFLCWALENHRFALNDEKYFLVSWWHVPAFPLFIWAGSALIPFFVGQILYSKWPRALGLALALLTISSLWLMIACAFGQDTAGNRMTYLPGLNRIASSIENPSDGGYFLYAVRFHIVKQMSVGEILRQWPDLLPTLYGHVFNKPPGLVVFFVGIISMFGANVQVATTTGIITGILAADGVVATYWFIRHFTDNRNAAFCGASYFALCPALIEYFPTFDQVYPLLTVCLTISWSLTLRRRSVRFAGVFGVLLALTLFLNYLPGALVFFLGGLTIFMKSHENIPWKKTILLCATPLATVALVYLLLFIVWHFDPIATFKAAQAAQDAKLQAYTAVAKLPIRKLPGTILWDLYGFGAGSGWMSYVLAAILLAGVIKTRGAIRWIVLLSIGQFLFVAFTGLIQSETARLWLFMLPMLMLPVGMQLSQMPTISRWIVYLALGAVTIVTMQSVVFLV
jgi:hypothetical protein